MNQVQQPHSPFKNIKAVIGGAIIGIVVFAGVVGYHAAFPNYAPGAGPSVTSRPIKKDDNVKYMVFALALGCAGFFFGTKAIAGRLEKK